MKYEDMKSALRRLFNKCSSTTTAQPAIIKQEEAQAQPAIMKQEEA